MELFKIMRLAGMALVVTVSSASAAVPAAASVSEPAGYAMLLGGVLLLALGLRKRAPRP
jgi:hypothetical protein